MPAGWGCYSIAFIVYFRQVLVQQGNSTFVLKVNTRDTKSVALTDIVLITFFITFESTQDSVQIFLFVTLNILVPAGIALDV